MRESITLLIAAALLLLSTRPLAAAEPASSDAGADQKKENEVLAGHSAHGEAFNQGPRQKAYLMGTTGKVHFPATTAGPLAQQFIDQGVGQLHGFWYFEAERSFRQAAALDPDCAIAYWGMAMANKNNANRASGFIAEAGKRKSKASERERMYIDALDAYLKEKDRKKRGEGLIKAMENIALKFPDDLEAKAFLALAMYNHRPIQSYFAVDGLLQQVLKENPLHPVHHYVIHLWDYKKPKLALDSAALCGRAAPGIAHMWHMPGHTYSRLKRYREACWQQGASARVDHAHMIRDRVMPDQIHNFAHNNEWFIRNMIHVGRMHDALDLAKNMIELPRHPDYNTVSKRNCSACYGRRRLFEVLTKFELWREMIELARTPYLEPTDQFSEQIKRLRHLGRAYFAAGELERGRKLLARLERDLATQNAAANKAADRAASRIAGQNKEPIAAARPRHDRPVSPRRNRKPSSPTKRIEKARSDARRPFQSKIRELERAVRELKGRNAIAGGDYKTGIELIKKAGGVEQTEIARLQLASGAKDEAIKTAKSFVERNENEVLPLAVLVEVLWKAGNTQQARERFEQLRSLASDADLDAPALSRLAPLAGELEFPSDWRIPYEPPEDFGTRPPLDSLGPFRWSPPPAPAWTLKDADGREHSLADYRGRPVVVIFYLGYGCLHCAEQLQAFAPRAERFAEAGIDLIAVSTDDEASLQKSCENYKEGRFPFPLVSDDELDVFRAYRAYDDFENVPLHGTYLIDGKGRVRWQDISYEPFMQPDFLLKETRRLLAQPPGQGSEVRSQRSGIGDQESGIRRQRSGVGNLTTDN